MQKLSKSVVSLAAVLLTLTSCVSMSDDPYIQSFGNDEVTEAFDNTSKNKQLSYLGRYLVDADTRREIVANAYEKEFLESWSSADYGNLTAMLTDLAVGDLGSALGSDLGAIVSVGSMLLGAASSSDYDVIGQAWLPEQFDGTKIDSSAAAHSAFSQFVDNQMADMAEQFGYTVRCLSTCAQRSKVFEFVQDGEISNDKPHGYEPKKFVAMVNIPAEFEAIEENDILPIMIGQPIRWKLPPYYTLKLGFYTQVKRDEQGEVIVDSKQAEGYTIEYVSARRDLLNVPFGRMLMQAFHNTPYTIHGSDDLYPSQLFFNGNAYTFFDGSDPMIIEKKVTQQYQD
ncbi:hypothetical protein [Idiomarina seosinensis]|uniref:Lipoprotein n=1 Tax=Idiomarina seosinensis TaxID=281739 RepID=A0A432ZI03_9GAMM|nr:hypothetical protein [Idiomarina seosinensis]RUO77533.1 hypothetical protein CWI81_03380 [Idiomarina seosinensis]